MAEEANAEVAQQMHINSREIQQKLAEWLLQNTHVKPIERYDIVKGRVLKVGGEEVVLELEYKFNGVVPLVEFRGESTPVEGDWVEVYVERSEDKKGQVKLSRKKARLLRAWERLVEAHKTGEVLEGVVTAKTRGGLIVEMFGIYECFLPGSQIDVQPVQDYNAYLGKHIPVKVVKLNEEIMNAVVSRRAVIEEELEKKRKEIIAKLERGQIVEGVVKNIVDYGVFVNLGGIDGLVYISDLSWRRLKHPSELVKVGDKLRMVVLDFDREKGRVSLGVKQLEPNPWENLPPHIKEGARVKGKVVHVEPWGAFIEVVPGVEGLLHRSEMTWSERKANSLRVDQIYREGDEVEVEIISIDKENRRMSFSTRLLQGNPWENIEVRYPVGSKHKGIVVELKPEGAMIELEDGVEGIVYNEDFSWLRRLRHPKEKVKEGDELEVVVLSIDKEKRQLRLGHKQLTENPWPTFSEVFSLGSQHEAMVSRIFANKEAILEMPYGVEARAFLGELKKKDGSFPRVGDTIVVEVTEFDPVKQLIRVSHKKVWQAPKKKKAETPSQKAEKGEPKVKGAVKLGEIGVFSELKEKLAEETTEGASIEEHQEKQHSSQAEKAPAPEPTTKKKTRKKKEK